MMGMFAYFRRLALWMVVAFSALAAGQIFNLEQVGEVQPRATSVQYVYYALSEDEQHSGSTVAVKALAVPDMKAPAPAKPKVLHTYEECYIVLMPAHFYDLVVDPAKVCERLSSGEEPLPNAVSFQVLADDPGPRKATLKKSGMYYVVIANCGSLSGFELAGDVTVTHAHGLLPALHMHMTALYVASLAAYIIISLLWGCVLTSKSGSTLPLHWYFMAVSVTAAIECLVWLVFYSQWNSGGAENQFLLVAASFASTWKVLMIFRMAFSAKFPPGQEDAGMWEGDAVNFALSVWSLFAFNLGFAHYYRSHMPRGESRIVLHALPAIIITGVVVLWAEKRLADEVSALKEIRYDAHVSNLQKSQAILGLSAMAALVASLVHIFDPTLTYDASSWGGHALTSDGLSQLVFAVALGSAMFVWSPSEEMQGRAYFPQPTSLECEAVGAVFDDSCLDDAPGSGE